MAIQNVYAVIMAGGKGTRLWPLSRASFPKQFLSFSDDGKSLLQAAVDRAILVVGSMERVIVVVQREHQEIVQKQLPDLPIKNLLLEPVGRNTAACIGFAAFHLLQRDENAIMAVFPADHLYDDVPAWVDSINAAISFANSSDYLITIGLNPEHPSPNYGYIQKGKVLKKYTTGMVYQVERFVEKPDVTLAEQYLKSGAYLWNTGTFCWRVSSLIDAMERYLPSHYQTLSQAMKFDASDENFVTLYQSLENISVDYGIMEKAENVAVVEGHFRKIDLGNLTGLQEVFPADEQGNVIKGQSVCLDGENNIVVGLNSEKKLTVLFGVSDLIVIHQDDVVFVCPKSASNNIRSLLNDLKSKGFEEFL